MRRHAQHRRVERRIAERLHVRDQGRVAVAANLGDKARHRLAQGLVAADRPREPIQKRLQLTPIAQVGIHERA